MTVDDEQEKPVNQDEVIESEQETTVKLPSENDFMAGAMLANGIVFVWMQLLSVFRQLFSQIPQGILVDVSYLIYILASYIATRQVVKRTKKEHLKIGLKTAGYSSIMGLLITFSMINEPTMSFAFILAICYFAGSILASYMAIKARLSGLSTKASS